MGFTLCGARLVDATMDVTHSDITIDGAHIRAIGRRDNTGGGDVIDATDAIVMPGFIEIHTHGGGGFNLHTTDAEEIHSYARWIATTGVTSFLIAVVGTPNALPEPQLAAATEAIEHYGVSVGAEPVGIYLEGPYLNPQRRGAHPPAWLRIPNETETEHVLDLTKGHLRLITLAPELPGAAALIRRMVEAGVTVSMGHTDANYEQTQAAIQQGVTHMTHCFNAMRPLLHREPGPIAAIAQAQQVRGELIADGIHVHPSMVNILLSILGPQRTVVITDAQAGAGVPEATFEFGGQLASVICGAARLEDGTLAGSILTMDQALRNILEMTHVSLQQAVGMMTLNPALAAQVTDRKGTLQVGCDADLLIFDSSLTLQATICRGQVAFATEAWSKRLKHQ